MKNKKNSNNDFSWVDYESKRIHERIATHMEYDNWFWK